MTSVILYTVVTLHSDDRTSDQRPRRKDSELCSYVGRALWTERTEGRGSHAGGNRASSVKSDEASMAGIQHPCRASRSYPGLEPFL